MQKGSSEPPSTIGSDLPSWYERMVRVRLFEQRAGALFKEGKLPGFLHSSEGQEAVAVGMTAPLRADDYITSTHRGHGHVIAKGASLRHMFAELFGKSTGICGGRGGSMHIMDISLGILGANGIVGAGIPIAVGAGVSCQLRATGQIVVCFFGDGAANTGAFHESLNLAAVWRVPVVFCCENNQYAESTPVRTMLRSHTIASRAESYGIPGVAVDGNDVLAVAAAASAAVSRAREGEGPTLIECSTYRMSGHYVGDTAPYRPESELESWRQRDPIVHLENHMRQLGLMKDTTVQETYKRVETEITEAVEFAASSPDPDPAQALLAKEAQA